MKNKLLKVFFSYQFILGLFGCVFWFVVIRYTDDFSAGLIISLLSTLIAFIWAREELNRSHNEQEKK